MKKFLICLALGLGLLTGGGAALAQPASAPAAAPAAIVRAPVRDKLGRAYATGKRKNAIMAGFAATLSDDDMRNVAAFYASKQAKLAAKAVVEGNIHYNLIEIEKGAEVVGSFIHEQPQTNVTAFPKEGRGDETAETAKKADKQSL